MRQVRKGNERYFALLSLAFFGAVAVAPHSPSCRDRGVPAFGVAIGLPPVNACAVSRVGTFVAVVTHEGPRLRAFCRTCSLAPALHLVVFAMKQETTVSLDDLSLTEVRARFYRARGVLRMARSFAGRFTGSRALNWALEEVERLMPGLDGQPRALLARIIRDLGPREREVLRAALDSERLARERLSTLLGAVTPAEAEDALVRVEAQESITTEVLNLFRQFERGLG